MIINQAFQKFAISFNFRRL